MPLFGLPLERRLLSRSSNVFLRLGFSGAAGLIVLCAEMLLLTVLGILWSVWLLAAAPAVLFLFGRHSGDGQIRLASGPERVPLFDVALILLTLCAVVYATVTGRATGGDFLLFWGAKGEHFALSRSIDVAFLLEPFHLQIHPPYPPLVPLLYAWGSMVAGRLSWWAALFTMPIALALTGCAFLGFVAPSCGRARATTWTAVLVAMLGLVMVAVPVAGNAEPLLLYFEAVALSALLFGAGGDQRFVIAGIGLAGAAMTKMEGCVFALLVIAAQFLFGRDRGLRALVALAAPPVIIVGGWVAFCRAHGLGERYDLPAISSLSLLPLVLREMGRRASFDVGYAPWIAPLVIAIGGRWSAEARTAAAVALGFVGAMVCIYLGGGRDSGLWILWSAGRLFMTPLLCCFLAAAAAHRGPPATDRVPPLA